MNPPDEIALIPTLDRPPSSSRIDLGVSGRAAPLFFPGSSRGERSIPLCREYYGELDLPSAHRGTVALL